MLKVHAMALDGALLARGFWLYIWRVTHKKRSILCVGRTGDLAAARAASPLEHIGQQFDARPRAKGNAVGRQLKRRGLTPERCSFELVAIGPLFPERKDKELHKSFREQTAALERAIADQLRANNYEVIGTRLPQQVECDEALRAEVCRIIDEKFPPQA